MKELQGKIDSGTAVVVWTPKNPDEIEGKWGGDAAKKKNFKTFKVLKILVGDKEEDLNFDMENEYTRVSLKLDVNPWETVDGLVRPEFHMTAKQPVDHLQLLSDAEVLKLIPNLFAVNVHREDGKTTKTVLVKVGDKAQKILAELDLSPLFVGIFKDKDFKEKLDLQAALDKGAHSELWLALPVVVHLEDGTQTTVHVKVGDKVEQILAGLVGEAAKGMLTDTKEYEISGNLANDHTLTEEELKGKYSVLFFHTGLWTIQVTEGTTVHHFQVKPDTEIGEIGGILFELGEQDLNLFIDCADATAEERSNTLGDGKKLNEITCGGTPITEEKAKFEYTNFAFSW